MKDKLIPLSNNSYQGEGVLFILRNLLRINDLIPVREYSTVVPWDDGHVPYLIPCLYSRSETISNLLKWQGMFRYQIHSLSFNNILYEGSFQHYPHERAKDVESLVNSTKSGDLLRKFYKNTFTVEDLYEEVNLYTPEYYYDSYLEYITFEIEVDKDSTVRIREWLGVYINKFVNNELTIWNENKITFNKHREIGDKLLLDYTEKFGSEFIIFPLAIHETGFQPLHYFLTLEHLGEIEIKSLQAQSGKTNGKYYLKLKVNKLHKKEKLKEDENRINFDEINSALLFDGNVINISSSRDTDQHYLLKTLFSDLRKRWSNDEILESWGFDPLEVNHKKVYFAARAVNEKIAKETTVKDLIEYSTKDVQINRKYISL